MDIEIRKYRWASGVIPYDRWIAKLRDGRARARILIQVDRLKLGLPGDWKPVGEGVFELRIFEGKGYRVYFAREGRTRVILLSGGDKSTQVRDIGGQGVLVGLPETTMKTAAFKTSDYLKTQKEVIAYLNAALEDGEPAVLLEALRNVAQARGGMAALAKSAGVSRESLYRTLSRRGNPKIDTIMELLRALGLKLTIGRDKAA